jgi:hypothetical protein
MLQGIGRALARSAKFGEFNDTSTASGKGAQLAYALLGGKQNRLWSELQQLQNTPQRSIPNGISRFTNSFGTLAERDRVVNFLGRTLKNNPKLDGYDENQLTTLQNAADQGLKRTEGQAFRRNILYPGLSLALTGGILWAGKQKIDQWNQETISINDQLSTVNSAKEQFNQSAGKARVRSSQ